MSDRQLRLFGEEPASDEVGRAEPGEIGDTPHDVVGGEHELRLDEEQLRKTQGSFYTPPDVVDALVGLTLGPVLTGRSRQGIEAVAALRVLDPACGTGNFLVAAGHRIAEVLVGLGVAPGEASRVAFTECVAGVDIDAESVRLCRAVLARESGLDHVPDTLIDRVVCTNSLLLPLEDVDVPVDRRDVGVGSWESLKRRIGAEDGFDLVIGNPPFLAQLRTETKFDAGDIASLSERFGDLVHRYVDPAILFLFLATQLVGPEGCVCMIQPVSSLAVVDASRARRAILDRAGFELVWIANERVFDAAVDVCAVGLRPSRQSDRCVLYTGRGFSEGPAVRVPTADDGSWSSFLARAAGVPEVVLRVGGNLTDVVDATADFRDQYYGLAGHVIDRESDDDPAFPPLVTSGLIDPMQSLWGRKRTKFNKEWFESPCVDLGSLDGSMRAWAGTRLVPKLLVATQTKVIECVVDEDGKLLPSVPVLTVTAKDSSVERLWKAAAVLIAPPIVALCLERHLGAALGADAIKLSARQLLELPIPVDEERWSTAAALLAQAEVGNMSDAIEAAAMEMCRAYEVSGSDALFDWWQGRMKGGRNAS